MTVLFGPYLTAIANKAGCPNQPTDTTCNTDLHVVGIPVAPGSLVAYTLTVSTIIAALLLIIIGAIADRSPRPHRLFALFAFGGAAAATAMWLIQGSNWKLGVTLAILANLGLCASLIVYSALMIDITPPDDRDHVSSRGWSYGYAGGGLVLAVGLGLLSFHEKLGLSTGDTVRLLFAISGIWWAAFAVIPIVGLRDVRAPGVPSGRGLSDAVSGSLRQLRQTLGELRGYPQTWRFLIAYLFYNDGIQTVISAASLYGKYQLGFSDSQLILTILFVQIIAFGGALTFGTLAGRHGAHRMILTSLVLWSTVVFVAWFLPRGNFTLWMVLAAGIGMVLGGSQALSRSLYSHLIPRGRESEFFSLYQAMERGTSWLGTLVFGLVYQLFHDYRFSIVALMIFFVVGGLLLRTVKVREGIADVGNRAPAIV